MAQIVAVSDIFDALCSQRGYKKPMPKERVEAILYEQFRGDEKFVEQIMERYDN